MVLKLKWASFTSQWELYTAFAPIIPLNGAINCNSTYHPLNVTFQHYKQNIAKIAVYYFLSKINSILLDLKSEHKEQSTLGTNQSFMYKIHIPSLPLKIVWIQLNNNQSGFIQILTYLSYSIIHSEQHRILHLTLLRMIDYALFIRK